MELVVLKGTCLETVYTIPFRFLSADACPRSYVIRVIFVIEGAYI